jgi:hypothetical protein
MSMDHRQQAQARIETLISELRAQPPEGVVDRLVSECESLVRAIGAFHMEGIRFRMYNVDRLLHRTDLALPPDARTLFADARRELEAAGFHTRSHQAPG